MILLFVFNQIITEMMDDNNTIFDLQQSRTDVDFIIQNADLEVEIGANVLEILMNFPYVGSLFKLGKIALSFIDYRFVKKLRRFLMHTYEIPEEKVMKFLEDLSPKDKKRISDYLTQLLYSVEEEEKASIMGKIYVRRVLGDIDNDMMLRLCSIVSRAFISDLSYLGEYQSVSDANTFVTDNLVALGILADAGNVYEESGEGWASSGFGPTKHTLNEIGITLYQILNDKPVLLNYEKIIAASGVMPNDLLEQVQTCEGDIEYKLFTEWPISLFVATKTMDTDMAKEINQHALEFLREESTDKWKEQLLKPGFELKLWNVYKQPLIHLKDAAISVLTKYATEGNGKPDKQQISNVLSEHSEARYKLTEEFKGIYDVIVKKPTKDNVADFTSWLFEYGVISSEDAVSALYKTVLLDDQTVLAELVKVGDKLNGIKLPEDFVEKMAQMAIGNRKTDEALVGMCRNNGQINAEMEKLLHPEGEDEK